MSRARRIVEGGQKAGNGAKEGGATLAHTTFANISRTVTVYGEELLRNLLRVEMRRQAYSASLPEAGMGCGAPPVSYLVFAYVFSLPRGCFSRELGLP